MDDFKESLIAYPAIRRLRALVPRGFDAVHKTVRRALRDDDYSQALKEANARYARRGVDDYHSTLTYACLLVGRELVVEARGLLKKAMGTHGKRPALLALLADAYVLAGDLDEAKDVLFEIDLDRLESASVASFVADVWLDLGEEDEAMAFYQRAVDMGVDDPEPAIRLGQLYLGRDELRAGAEAYAYAARLAKGRTGLWQATADLWFELGEDIEGLRARKRVLALADAEAEEWLDLGFGFAEVGAFDDALEALSKAEHLDPFMIEPFLIRGHVLLEMGRAEEAMVAFQKVETQKKDLPGVARGMAEAALIIGDLVLAESRAKRAVELAPDDPEAHFVFGRVQQQFGRHEKAIEAFEKASELEAEQPAYAASRALSLVSMGRVDDAESALRQAVEHAERHPDQLPVMLDEESWQRAKARVDASDAHELNQELDQLLDVLRGERTDE